MFDKDYSQIKDKLITWIQKQVENADCRGTVVGLSGGIDSSVTGTLCKKAFPENTLGIIMPCHSNPEDQKDAEKVAEKFQIDYKVINLNHSFNTLLKELEANVNKITQNQNSKKIARANLKPRLRMTVLYYYANLNNYLVVGTDNKSELKLGYFTKYGDGGIDIAPLGNLVKTEVKKIAEILNIPKPIINKKPSAGLWEGQNDENELGISYKKIDKYILTGKADNKTKKIVDKYSYQNQHKLKPPTIPEF